MARRRLPAKIAWNANCKRIFGNQCTCPTNARPRSLEMAILVMAIGETKAGNNAELAFEQAAEKVASGQEPRPQRLKPHSKQCSYRSAEALRHPKSRAKSSFSAACYGPRVILGRSSASQRVHGATCRQPTRMNTPVTSCDTVDESRHDLYRCAVARCPVTTDRRLALVLVDATVLGCYLRVCMWSAAQLCDCSICERRQDSRNR